MTFLDLIIVIVILIGFILGFKDGFVRKIIGLLGFIGAVILAALFYEKVGVYVESITGIEIYLSFKNHRRHNYFSCGNDLNFNN